MRKIFPYIFFIFLFSCDPISEKVQKLSEDQSKDLNLLSAELSSEAALLNACETDDDCITIGFKPKGCGGYENFVAISLVSNKDSEITEERPSEDYDIFISRLIAYQSRYKNELKKAGMVSTLQ
jgi:hypothetical protein